jgi:hypothetical protein
MLCCKILARQSVNTVNIGAEKRGNRTCEALERGNGRGKKTQIPLKDDCIDIDPGPAGIILALELVVDGLKETKKLE